MILNSNLNGSLAHPLKKEAAAPASSVPRIQGATTSAVRFSAQMKEPEPFIRKTKIIATLGSQSDSPEMIEKLIRAGADRFRLNFAQGTHALHGERMKRVRDVVARMQQARTLDRPITLMADIQGPRLEVGSFPGGKMELVPGAQVKLSPKETTESPNIIPTTYPELIKALRPGHSVLVDDGKMELKVLEAAVKGGNGDVLCQVVRGGTLTSQKGINVPQVPLKTPALTEKDKQDLSYALANNIDEIALSFVQNDQDVRDVKAFAKALGKNLKIIAKIERPQSVEPEMLQAIVETADGVMVARGDLGIEMGILELPKLQKRIIREAKIQGKEVVVANQLLTSMINADEPSRSNVFDIVDAIDDGADVLMLTAETGEGRFPVKAVETVDKIIRQYEPAERHEPVSGLQRTLDNLARVGRKLFRGLIYLCSKIKSLLNPRNWFSGKAEVAKA